MNPSGRGDPDPDFKGQPDAVTIDAQPEVFAHNLETVPRIFKRIHRPSRTSTPWTCSRRARSTA
ncbi:hypothetical protein QJS66_05135 [Kocuria rhizophila]|nr:hypothetical protein QJS66_05135 [Kocuria rhizophila]